MRATLWLVALALAALPAFAQEDPAAVAAEPATDAAEQSGIQEEAVKPGDYAYDVGGRRDPFVSLLANVTTTDGERIRPPGIAGFLIQETVLKGIVDDRGGFIAMLEASDGKSYFVRVGQKFWDGTIVAMDAATVTFRQDVRDPLARERTREVIKSLYPSEEAR